LACRTVVITTKCISCAERPLPRPSGYESVLSRRRFTRSICTWTVSNIPRLTKTLHQSYNDGMVNPEVVCHPSMAKTTVLHANSARFDWSHDHLGWTIRTRRRVRWSDESRFLLGPTKHFISGQPRACLDMSRYFLSVVLRGLPARGRSVIFPV
jgi:hypothetical protein